MRYLQSIARIRNEAVIRGLCATVALGPEDILCRVLGRYKMIVDAADAGLSLHLMLDGYWEMWLTELMVAEVKPGQIAIDVGANLGYFSLLLADLVGETGKVFAFEPNASIVARLRRSAAANGFTDRLHIHDKLVGDEQGALFQLVVPNCDPKNGFMVPAAEDATVGSENVLPTYRLDTYPELLNATVVKIDADTAEQAVWRGMRGIFDRGNAMTIFLEFNLSRYRDPEVFLDDIEREGFALGRLEIDDGEISISRAGILNGSPNEDQLLVLRRSAMPL